MQARIYIVFFTITALLFSCTSKSKLIAKKWMVTETEVAGQKLNGELVDGFYLEIKEDSTYKLVGMGEENGKWVVKGDSLVTTNDENRTVSYYIKDLSDKSLVLYDNSVGANTSTSFKAE